MDYNYTSANLANRRQITTAPLYQYDYGQILVISGIDLPDTFEVHFSVNNQPTKTVMGSNGEVAIPDYCLTVGSAITAYIFLHSGADDGETEYVIKIPVTRRPVSTNIAPTEVQQSAITQAIAALNGALDDAEDAVARAEDAARRAEEAAAEGGGGGASNWVNGTAEGSVRTIGATAESSSYTMGKNAVAEGVDTEASGDYSHAEGERAAVTGKGSHAEGYRTGAPGNYAHAEGSMSTAAGNMAHAEGQQAMALGLRSHAEGQSTTASGENAHAEGSNTQATGAGSHAEGASTQASGKTSHAEGLSTVANHASQHVFGEFNIPDPSAMAATGRGTYVEIVGNGSSGNARSNARTLDWNGNETLAGKLTVGAGPTDPMDAATKQYVDSKGSGAFWVTMSFGSEGPEAQLDASYTQIRAALDAGIPVYVTDADTGELDYFNADPIVYCAALSGSEYVVNVRTSSGIDTYKSTTADGVLKIDDTLLTGRVVNISEDDDLHISSFAELERWFNNGDQVILRKHYTTADDVVYWEAYSLRQLRYWPGLDYAYYAEFVSGESMHNYTAQTRTARMQLPLA